MPPPAEALPADLCWEVGDARAEQSVLALLGRRDFLKAMAVAAAALTLPATGVRRAYAKARGRFLTRAERATLEALCDRIIPPDKDPGAGALGAVDYVDGLLTAFDHDPPRIFAGGPFSGRTPYPDTRTGRPSRRRPRNEFKHFITLSRVQELRWRAEIFGSDTVPGADYNDAALGPLIGLRQLYREGLAKVDQVARATAGAPFARLSSAKQDSVFKMLDAPNVFRPDPRRGMTFIDLVIEHTLEGCFAAPEYGGNRHARGWRLLGLEGDSQPLGYSLFSTQKDGYNERRRHPMSTANPDELAHGRLHPRPISEESATIQRDIATFAGPFEAC
jgi:hypothetical protein